MKIVERYLTVNEFSRTGKPRRETLGVVAHYIGVDFQTAEQVRAYFEGLKNQDAEDNVPDRSASAHEIIDHDGTVLLVVPIGEKAYHCGSATYTDKAKRALGDYAKFPERTSPNSCLIGIELCHGKDGAFSDETIKSAIQRFAKHCKDYKLDPLTQIYTHEEIVGWKKCPLYWSRHPELFSAFKKDVARALEAL